MTIRRLEESVVVRIAAGEVIERPASVVKELVENAFDAGAKTIQVRIERGGLGLIEVVDDGCGIPPAELPIAIERHATSKIRSAEDLDTIATMGFRGEALAAIAAAGFLTIISKTDAADAARLVVHGSAADGQVTVEPAARGRGTTVLVRDLFVRTPARLRFMKSETAELARLSEMLERLAVARPDVVVELMRDGRRVFRTPGRGSAREAIAEVHGAELARELIEVSAEGGGIAVRGLISPPHISRRNRTGIWIDLASRPIEDRTVAHAIVAAYEGLLPSGQFPFAFLSLAVPPSDADVNVHPAKAEVRFRDGQRVHRIVSQALRERLRGDVSVPTLASAVPGGETGRSATALELSGGDRQASLLDAIRSFEGPGLSPVAEAGDESATTSHAEPDRRLRLGYAGEIAGRYLVAESPEGLVLIDQHAAHERVIFDRLMREAAEGSVVEQPLLAPYVLEATGSERALAEETAGFFREIGFELEIWPDSIAVKSAPALLGRLRDAGKIVRDVIDTLRAGGETTQGKVPYARLAREACKAAVKGTQRLHREEAMQLIDDLLATTDPYNCPHGRPTMIRMTIEELDRRFGRS